jgi:hypothetical protein
MNDFYINQIHAKKRKYPELYKEIQKEIFGKTLTWKEMQIQERDILRGMMIKFSDCILYHESPIDVKKLAQAIQHTRSGIGGCAITKYICHFCGSEESWSNTATPGICRGCATKMADNIAKYSPDIFKDEVKADLQIDTMKLKKDMEMMLIKHTNKSKDNEDALMHAGSKFTLELLIERLENGEYSRK